MKITFTQADILEAMQLEPGWYQIEIIDVNSAPGSKDPTSTTHTIKSRIISGDAQGVEVRTFFSEKMMSKMLPFIRVFVGEEIKPGASFEINQLVGRKLEAYGKWDPKMNWNTFEDWRPIQS